MIAMAKKATGGKHVTERTTIQIPSPWLKVARTMASERRQPVLWFILGLIAEEAAKSGVATPPLPWQKE
jgi:hypothetical protein